MYYFFASSPGPFHYEEKSLYLCYPSGGASIRSEPCWKRKDNYIQTRITEVDTGNRVYIDLCENSYHVKFYGEYRVIGEPEFTHESSRILYLYEASVIEEMLEEKPKCRSLFTF